MALPIDLLLNTKEVASILGIHPNTLRTLTLEVGINLADWEYRPCHKRSR